MLSSPAHTSPLPPPATIVVLLAMPAPLPLHSEIAAALEPYTPDRARLAEPRDTPPRPESAAASAQSWPPRRRLRPSAASKSPQPAKIQGCQSTADFAQGDTAPPPPLSARTLRPRLQSPRPDTPFPTRESQHPRQPAGLPATSPQPWPIAASSHACWLVRLQ